MSKKEDKELIKDIVGHDARVRNEAFRHIYKTSFHHVKTMVIKYGETSEMAEDIFQEGVTILYQNLRLNKFKGDSSIHTYLYNICRYRCYKALSTQKNLMTSVPEEFTDEQNLSPHIDPKTVTEIINTLKPDCRHLLIDFYYKKKNMEEIASDLGFMNSQVARNKKLRCMKSFVTKIKELKLSYEDFVK